MVAHSPYLRAKCPSIKTGSYGSPRPLRGPVPLPDKGYTLTDRKTGLEFWACVDGVVVWHAPGQGYVFDNYHSAHFTKFDLTNDGYVVFVSKLTSRSTK